MSDKDAKTAGAIAGTAVVAGIIAATEGLSAAGLTSTLATWGLGSMATGIAVTSAAPLAAGVAVYGLYKWLKDK